MRTHRTLFALYLLFLGEVFRVEGAGGVQNSEDHDADIGEDGRPHVGDTQSTQQQAGRLDGQSKDDVLVDDALGAAGNAHGEGDLGRVVIHQDDDPAKISLAMRISRKCMRIVYQNIVFALAVKALCLILSALGITNMWWGVFADVGVMILAVLNATRMLNVKEYQ